MDTAIQTLLKAAIKAVQPAENQFISSLFLVEKVQFEGEYRPIINLKPLNRFVEEWPFKMDSLPVVCIFIQPNDYMMKLDLKDAFQFTQSTADSYALCSTGRHSSSNVSHSD
jgi:hypothetical protein